MGHLKVSIFLCTLHGTVEASQKHRYAVAEWQGVGESLHARRNLSGEDGDEKRAVQSGRPKTETLKPIKETLSKSAIINRIAEENDLPRKTAMFAVSTHPRGLGEFTLPGLMKVSLRKVPARKAGTLVRNPSTGEMMKGAARPASVRVKIRALSKLKSAAGACLDRRDATSTR